MHDLQLPHLKIKQWTLAYTDATHMSWAFWLDCQTSNNILRIETTLGKPYIIYLNGTRFILPFRQCPVFRKQNEI